ncbi:hypothetical protein Sjap_016907 [Stephania japonica]|uniref:BTB domain-containing protein n=1 Tax=Stephania japonica TaxID=461633 RepID=A0AAP0NHS8_9MAGN
MIRAAIDATDIKEWKSGKRRRLIVESLTRDFASKGFVKVALSKAFNASLSKLKKLFKKYLQLPFSDRDRISSVMKQWMWLVERVIDLGVANDAASEWSNEASLPADSIKILRNGNVIWKASIVDRQRRSCPIVLLEEMARGASVTHRPSLFHHHSSPSDVILRLYFDPLSPSSHDDLVLSLHSDLLRQSNYFSALFSNRWKKPNSSSDKGFRLNLSISSLRYESFDDHLKVLHLFYTKNFAGSTNNISAALSIIQIAIELLFEECVTACVRFIEAVAWTDEEQQMVM